MAKKVTYKDRQQSKPYSENGWNAQDANELKSSVNELVDEMELLDASLETTAQTANTAEQTAAQALQEAQGKEAAGTAQGLVEALKAGSTETIASLNTIAIDVKNKAEAALSNIWRHVFIAEDRARRAFANWSYAGTVRKVGVGQTYATITAAYNAAVSGDIIELIDGVYDTAAEAGGYLLINSSSKRILIRGNANDRSKVVVKQSAAASYCVRLRVSNEVTFQDLTITSNQANSTIQVDRNVPDGGTSSAFINCVIENTNPSNSITIQLLELGTKNGSLELRNCVVKVSTNASARPIHCGTPTLDSNTSTYPILISGCTMYGYMYWGDSKVDFAMYDTAVIQQNASSSYVFGIGQDVAQPTNWGSSTDIRSCVFRYENGYVGHAVLLGRGTKKVYFVNNSLFMASSINSLALGIVVKSIADTLGDVVIDGNLSETPRPLYLKGAKKCYVRYNTCVSNWGDATNGFGFELNNPNNPDGTIVTEGNVIIHNNLTGKKGALGTSEANGAEVGLVSLPKNIFDRNLYYVPLAAPYILSSYNTPYTFAQRATVWSQDAKSVFISK